MISRMVKYAEIFEISRNVGFVNLKWFTVTSGDKLHFLTSINYKNQYVTII